MFPKHIVLSDSMTLDAITTDRFKTACLSVSAAVTADAAQSPLDTLFLGVMGRGSSSYPTLRALNRRMDELYDLTLFSRNYRMGDLQILGSGAYFLDPAFLPLPALQNGGGKGLLEENIRMLFESIYAPLFRTGKEHDALFADYVEKEKAVQIDQIRSEISSPAAYAEMRARERTFFGEPYGVSFSGSEEQVRTFTKDDLIRRYDAFWRHASLRFFFVGSAPAETIGELIKKVFRCEDGSLVSDGKIAPAVPPLLRKTGEKQDTPGFFSETLLVTQGKLVMYFSAPADLRSEDLFAAMVYNEILGGSPASRLFLNVREKKSLCYYCSSVFDFYKGCLSVASGIRKENYGEVREAVLNEVDALAKGRVGERELSNAKKYLVSVYTGLYDSASAIENYFSARSYFGVSVTPEECIAGIERVTREDVTAFAEKVKLLSVYFLSGRDGEGSEDAFGEEGE